jgi:two-component system sensor histidine kinase HydH/two-component system sensor histidine kinase AtoS
MSQRRAKLDAFMADVAVGIAHEVRNPLNAVQINLRILEEELGRLVPDRSAAPHEIVKKIASELQSLDDFVAEFLRFARPPRPRLESVPIRSLLLELAAFVEPECRRHEVTLVVRPAEQPATITCDPTLVKHALLNLVLNALHACASAGSHRIEISTRAEDGAVALVVRDDGTGIPPEILPRVFDAFFTTQAGGTGLGLPIARRIAEDHGGTLQLSSPPGGGTVATLLLPASRP